eukprot:GILJ01009442.1.p1 GENE.GILJ01009442.1~~GILJ01009442.1.p1  ORF type:complete len:1075 (+),score=214.11 GILJ01009442.1:133-3357(+)
MAETTKNLIEIIEKEYKCSLDYRARSVQYFTGLGPPDMCHITKIFERSLVPSFFGKSGPAGYFHFVVGLDTANPAAVSAYFQSLLLNQETANWFGTGVWRIVGGEFCLYNAFSKVDIRVEFQIPGIPAVKTYALTATGERLDVTDEMFEEAYVCSVLRSFHLCPRVPAIRYVWGIERKDQFERFLALVFKYYHKASQLGVALDEYALVWPQNNHMVATLVQYLLRRQRLSEGVHIFSRLEQADGLLGMHTSQFLRQLALYDEGMKKLADIMMTDPTGTPVLLRQVQLLIQQKNFPMALKVAKLAAELSPNVYYCWLLLAKVYLKMQRYDLALIALNVAPSLPPEPAANLGVIDFTDLEETYPLVRETEDSVFYLAFEPIADDFDEEDGEFNLQDHPEVDDASDDDDELVDQLALDKKLSRTMSLLPANGLNKWEQDAYQVLVEIEKAVGWEELLQLRSTIFLMEADDDDVQVVDEFAILKEEASNANKTHKDGATKEDTTQAAAHTEKEEEEVDEAAGVGLPLELRQRTLPTQPPKTTDQTTVQTTEQTTLQTISQASSSSAGEGAGEGTAVSNAQETSNVDTTASSQVESSQAESGVASTSDSSSTIIETASAEVQQEEPKDVVESIEQSVPLPVQKVYVKSKFAAEAEAEAVQSDSAAGSSENRGTALVVSDNADTNVSSTPMTTSSTSSETINPVVNVSSDVIKPSTAVEISAVDMPVTVLGDPWKPLQSETTQLDSTVESKEAKSVLKLPLSWIDRVGEGVEDSENMSPVDVQTDTMQTTATVTTQHGEDKEAKEIDKLIAHKRAQTVVTVQDSPSVKRRWTMQSLVEEQEAESQRHAEMLAHAKPLRRRTSEQQQQIEKNETVSKRKKPAPLETSDEETDGTYDDVDLESTQDPSQRKRLCTRWLDSLFHCLYDDLRMYLSWKQDEDDAKIYNRKKRNFEKISGTVWLGRGGLAERLQRLSDAERAYRLCVEKGWSLRAWYCLMKMYTEAGICKDALVCANQIIDRLQYDKVPKLRRAPYWVEESILKLICEHGLQEVLETQELIAPTPVCLERLYADAKLWEVDGFDW